MKYVDNNISIMWFEFEITQFQIYFFPFKFKISVGQNDDIIGH
jgi:hypothetical protein